MKLRMSKSLRFWVDCEYQGRKNLSPGRPRTELISQSLRRFEEAGDAMRYVNSDGKLAWKATPGMLSRLADAKREAIDDMEECP
jgi:hypothetical protein